MEITIGKKITFFTGLSETKTETSVTQIQIEEQISLHALSLLLYVEDDDICQRIVENFLRGICKLEFTKTGPEALVLANKSLYEGFLIDIHLSGMDGVQVTKELRKLLQYATTPIIAVTAFAMRGDKENFIEAGFTDYISKPFSKNELVTLIKKYFRK